MQCIQVISSWAANATELIININNVNKFTGFQIATQYIEVNNVVNDKGSICCWNCLIKVCEEQSIMVL